MQQNKSSQLEKVVEDKNLSFTQKSKRFFNSCKFNFYYFITPSIVFPFSIGLSDSFGCNVPWDIRYPTYAFGALMHLGKYQCPPAFSLPGDKVMVRWKSLSGR